MKLLWFLFASATLWIFSEGATGRGSANKQLYERLKSTYVPSRPDQSPVQLLIVSRLFQIISLDDKAEVLTFTGELVLVWREPALSWNKTEHSVASASLPLDKLWLPDIYIANSARETRNELWYKYGKARISSEGRVVWKINSDFSTTCSLDMTNFPVDKQHCYIDIALQVSLTNQVVFNLANITEMFLDQYTENGQWTVLSTAVTKSAYQYKDPLKVEFSCTRITIHLQRKARFYLLTILLPCLLLSLVTTLVFFLPPDSGEKMSLSITVLLSFTVYMLLVSELMPKTSTHTPLLAVYLIAVIASCMLALVCAVVVLVCHHQNESTPVPEWLLRLCQLGKPVHPMRNENSFGDRICDHDGKVHNCNEETVVNPAASGYATKSKNAAGRDMDSLPKRETMHNGSKRFIEQQRNDNDHELLNILHDLRINNMNILMVLKDIRDSRNEPKHNITDNWHEVAKKLDKLFFGVFFITGTVVNVWFFSCLNT